MDYVPAETELIHSTRVKVFDKHIGLLDKFCKDGLAVRCFSVKRERLLVRVELKEIIAWEIRIELKFLTCGIAYARTFDFNNIGTEPRKHLGT